MLDLPDDSSSHPIAHGERADDVEISIVLPRHRESFEIIDKTIRRIRQIQQQHSLQIIVVNDSKTDNFLDEDIRRVRIAHPDVTIISNAGNHGKGYSVRRGVEFASGKYIVYSDIDFPISDDDFVAAHHHLKKGNFDIVIGNRSMHGRVKANYYRSVTSKMFRRFVNVLLDRSVLDTQCPFKVLTASTAKELFSKQFVNGYAFDAEIVYLSRLLSKSLFQYPVDWEDTREDWNLLKTVSNYAVMISDLIRVKVYWDLKAGTAAKPRA